MSKNLIIAIVIVLVIVGVWYLVPGLGTAPVVAPSATATPAASPLSAVSGKSIVIYTDAGFSPSTLTVKKGDTVTFTNTASDAMWVASNPHPIHNGYPTTGGCIASTFDACKNIAPGGSWSFKFDLVGAWKYHNHLNPGEGGTIIVQ